MHTNINFLFTRRKLELINNIIKFTNNLTTIIKSLLIKSRQDMSSPYSLWSRLVTTTASRITGTISVATRAMTSGPSLLPLNDIRKLQGVFRKV